MPISLLLDIVISPDLTGQTVWHVLRRQQGISRTLMRRLKTQDGIRLDGRPVRVHERVAGGERLTLVEEVRASAVLPIPMALAIVHEDDTLVVLDKPVGVVVHPTRGHPYGTLANGLAHRLRQQGHAPVAHPVHRLDRETSGLVCFARSPLAAQRLGDQLLDRTMRRHYLAWVTGLAAADSGVLTGAIARSTEAAVREVATHGQAARTRYRVLARDPVRRRSLLLVSLFTGRTHQIRAHLAHLGHPLVGDSRYGGADAPRLALHAFRLTLNHPLSGKRLCLFTPLPADWRAAFGPAAASEPCWRQAGRFGLE